MTLFALTAVAPPTEHTGDQAEARLFGIYSSAIRAQAAALDHFMGRREEYLLDTGGSPDDDDLSEDFAMDLPPGTWTRHTFEGASFQITECEVDRTLGLAFGQLMGQL